jgi:hypothetical protein
MKAIDCLNDAMFAIGVSSDINPASPEMINVAFRRLLQWLTQMTAQGIYLGETSGKPSLLDLANLPTEPAGEIGNSPASDLSLAAALAPWLAPLFRVPVDKTTNDTADQAMQYLYTISAMPELPQWPSTLPVGGGNNFGPWGRTFFPTPAEPFPFIEDNDEGTIIP